MCNGSLVETKKHIQNVRNWVNYRTKSKKLNNSKRQIEQGLVELHIELQNNASTNK